MGNNSGNPSPSSTLQMTGADFIARLVQTFWRHCNLGLLCPLARLLQSIGQMVFFAMLRNTLTGSTPLELAACFHLANALMHRDLYAYDCESSNCRISAVTGPSAKETAIIQLALLILCLSLMDWHVPRWVPCQQLQCRILTAMSMHALRMDCACTAIAFFLPTFGKKPTPGKRTTATSLATEQTPATHTDTDATMQDPGDAPLLWSNGSGAESDAATEHITPALHEADIAITSLDDVVSELACERDESAVALCSAARILQRRPHVQEEIRRLCKPLGVQPTEKKESGRHGYRADLVLRNELTTVLVDKARKYCRERELRVLVKELGRDKCLFSFVCWCVFVEPLCGTSLWNLFMETLCGTPFVELHRRISPYRLEIRFYAIFLNKNVSRIPSAAIFFTIAILQERVTRAFDSIAQPKQVEAASSAQKAL